MLCPEICSSYWSEVVVGPHGCRANDPGAAEIRRAGDPSLGGGLLAMRRCPRGAGWQAGGSSTPGPFRMTALWGWVWFKPVGVTGGAPVKFRMTGLWGWVWFAGARLRAGGGARIAPGLRGNLTRTTSRSDECPDGSLTGIHSPKTDTASWACPESGCQPGSTSRKGIRLREAVPGSLRDSGQASGAASLSR